MSNELIGLIPAAGSGTRISPLPGSKELFPIGFQKNRFGDGFQLRPKVISQYLIDSMFQAGVQKIFMVLGRGKTDIMYYFSRNKDYGNKIAYLLDDEVCGMPCTMDVAWPWIKRNTVLFGMSDTIFTPTNAFSLLLSQHRSKKADLTLGIFPTDHPEKLCPVKLDQADRVLTMTDKPTNSEIKNTWGCGVWDSKFSEFMHKYVKSSSSNGGETILADVFMAAIEKGLSIFGLFFVDGEYIDIGTPDDLVQAVSRFSNEVRSSDRLNPL